MHKSLIIAFLIFGLVITVFLILSGPSNSIKPAYATITSIPTTSLEEKVCQKITEQTGDCNRILFYDTNSRLVFAESSIGIVPVLTNEEMTDIQKTLNIMDFQEFKEEKAERGPIDWRAANKVQKNFTVIYGFAEDSAKTIVITSERNTQPHRFYIDNNLWVWYATFPKNEVQLPVEVTVYDENGELIHGKNIQE